MKKLIKKIIKWINYKSVSIFCRFHFRAQVKKYCDDNGYKDIDSVYKNDIKNYWNKYVKHPSTDFHRWYKGANGIKNVKYTFEDFFYDVIERYYDGVVLEPAYSDKGMFKMLYPDMHQPDTFIKVQYRKMPCFGLASWNFTIDGIGTPNMIEVNLSWCGLNFHQLHHGLLFGDKINEIIEKVVRK